MRWLANEHMPLASIRRLRSAGHDVAAIIEDAPGIDDTVVLTRAAQEDRIILTFDRSYGELIYKRRLPPPLGIIYFRIIRATPEEPAERLLQLLTAPGFSLEGNFTILEPGQARQRALP
jgi:predicted nuclease of predicted toxin-antitoxin system